MAVTRSSEMYLPTGICMPGVLWFRMTNRRVPGVLVAYCLHLDISHFDKANDLIVEACGLC